MNILRKSFFFLIVFFAFAQGVWAQTFITDVMVIAGNAAETLIYKTQYQNEGWTVINKDLNAGANGSFVYLLYKTNESSGSSGSPISGFYLKGGSDSSRPETITHDGHTYYRSPWAGNDDLNHGAGGDYIFLYYTKDTFSPEEWVTHIHFNDNANGAVGKNGGTSGYDLNCNAGGEYIYMHVSTTLTGDPQYTYVDRWWNDTTHQVVTEPKVCSDFTELEGNNYDSYTELGDGWYVVYRNVDYKKCLRIVGNAHIILVDGATLNAKDGIYIKKNKTLTVYGQQNDSGKIYAHSESGPGIGGMKDTEAGHFVVKGGTIDAKAGSNNNAGIGGGNHKSGIQSVTIYGGTVRAEGKSSGAGIGKGQQNNLWEVVTIYGGDVTAIGGNNAAGIGGGEDRGNGEVVIWGGTVLAQGGQSGAGIGAGQGGSQDQSVTIHGGNVTAIGGTLGAGIGGGNREQTSGFNNFSGGHGGTVTINGGTVIATGGALAAAGIGGGGGGHNGHITINGGFVMAETSKEPEYYAAAIGSCGVDQYGDIEINGGEVVAFAYGYGAGIGGGEDAANIRISNAEVTAISVYGAGIGGGGSKGGGGGGDGGNVTITNSNVYAMSAGKGAGIGGGNDGDGGTVTINSGYVKAIGGYCKFSFFAEHGPSFIKGGNPVYSMAATALMTIFNELIHMGTFGGAGIGGGDDGDGGTVIINGGTVEAKGGYHTCSAIGKGDGGDSYGNIYISDGATVKLTSSGVQLPASLRVATCKQHAEVIIEPCTHEAISYTINDDGTHSFHCPHCNSSGTHAHEYDGQGHCVCGVDVGTSTVTLYFAAQNGNGYTEGVHYTVANTLKFYLPQANELNQLNFEGWKIGTPDQVGNSYLVNGYESFYGEGYGYTITQDVSFVARYKNYWNGEGKGAGTDPFIIATTDDLNQLATRVNNGETYRGKYFLMTADLEFDGTENNFIPIGTYSTDASFHGTFDGGGHYVSGININSTDEEAGVFVSLGDSPAAAPEDGWIGTIMNLTLKNSTITGTGAVGGIVGSNRGMVRNCHVTDDVHVGATTAATIGGVVGYNEMNIIECTSAANITAALGTNDYCGGVVGLSLVGGNNRIIASCLYTGGTLQGSSNVGALVGYTSPTPLYYNYYTTEGLNGAADIDADTDIYGHHKAHTISCSGGFTLTEVNGSSDINEEDMEHIYDSGIDLILNAVLQHEDIYYAAEGVTVSFKIEIDEGQGVSEVYCNNTLLTPDEDGRYTFTMPASNVIITATSTLPTFTNEGDWDDMDNWSYGTPIDGGDVIVAAPATINGRVNVGNVTLMDGGSITIADGAELFHSENLTATLEKEIVAYESDDDGWFTIASPVTYNLPTNGLVTSSEYDLYLYHEPTHYWWNVKNTEQHPDFNVLKHLEGYLYANAETVTLSFPGTMLGTNNTVSIPLSYTETAGNLKGYNLVGNPFTRRLTVADAIKIGDDDLTTYLVAEGDGELVPYTLAERPIEPGEGFFVQVTEAGKDLVINNMTRGEQTKPNPSYLRIEAGKEGFYDRAYVQVGGGNTLNKMSLDDNTTKVSVWHNNMDWSALSTEEAKGELPVNFKAAANGTYTLTIDAEGLELDYLHLIDNLTGADVDLLQTPSYSFEAKTTDYASRFKLVFSVNNDNNGNEDFAYISNSNLIVNGKGTLQVFDALGRQLFSRILTSDSCLLSSVFCLLLWRLCLAPHQW